MEIDATNLIIAEELLSRGWNPIPIIKGQKNPAVDWKPYQEKKVTLDDLNEWFGGTDNEIAVVTGKISGITVIDLDKKGNVDGEKTATDKRLNLPEECSRKSPNGIHHYIKYNPDIKQTQGILDGIDIRNDGGYIKVWDFEGEYDWLNDSPPVDYTHELLKKKQPKSFFVGGAVAPDQSPDLATVPEGNRHDFIVKETSRLMRILPRTEIVRTVTALVKTQCNPVPSDAEIVTTINDVIDRYQYDLDIKSIADIESRETEWLWHPYIPLNMVTLIAGMPSSMKSYFVIDLALRLTLKLPFASGETPKKNYNVLYFPVEDSLEQTIKTRIEKQGRGVPANLFVSEKTLNLTKWDAQERFKEELHENNIDVVILDPISSFLGGKDTNSESVVRPALEFLKSLESLKVTSLLIRHTNKGETQTNFDKVAGSGAWVQVVRSLLLVAKDSEERNKSLIKLEKNNLVADSEYMLELYNNDGVVELNEIPVDDETFNDSFNNKDNENISYVDTVIDFITEYLADHPHSRRDLIQEYCNSGEFKPTTVRRGLEKLMKKGLVVKEKGTGKESRKVFYSLSDVPDVQMSGGRTSEHLRTSGTSGQPDKTLIQQQDQIKKGEL